MIANPWCRLPERSPFILPEDEQLVRDFNAKPIPNRYQVQIEILSEPFVGAKDARVVLLSNNPGFGRGAAYKFENQAFMDRMRENLLHGPKTSDYPFVYLDPKFQGPGALWWRRKLKELINECGELEVARSILNVAYFPYASQKYRHGRLRLPSQEYSFQLVREAMKHHAVVVLMRKRAPWPSAVPALDAYGRLFRVNNWQNPAISRRNCTGFEEIVRAIKGSPN